MTLLVLVSFNFHISYCLSQSSQENKCTRTPTELCARCSAWVWENDIYQTISRTVWIECAYWSVFLCLSSFPLTHRPSLYCQSVITAISAVNKRAEYIIHSLLSTSAPHCIVKCTVKSENVNSYIKELFLYLTWPLKMTFIGVNMLFLTWIKLVIFYVLGCKR